MRSSLDVYRLVTPTTGSRSRSRSRARRPGYDPVRVTVFTVRGASTSNPNSCDDKHRDHAVHRHRDQDGGDQLDRGSAHDLGGGGVGELPERHRSDRDAAVTRRLVAGGEDADGGFGVIGSAPGAASVTHSWTLKADAAGRYAYLVSFSINPGSGGSTHPPPPTPPPPAAPGTATFGTHRDAQRQRMGAAVQRRRSRWSRMPRWCTRWCSTAPAAMRR